VPVKERIKGMPEKEKGRGGEGKKRREEEKRSGKRCGHGPMGGDEKDRK